ncbi:MAG: N-acetyl-gamma-glutamyl-phosphate reductase [Aquificaceae bacterium]
MEQEIKVCLYGATGYTGTELLRLLLNHPRVKIVSLTSQSYANRRLGEVFPFFEKTYIGNKHLLKEPDEDFDLAFLCLPHEASLELVPQLLSQGKKVIDLSGAYRIKDPQCYVEYYGFEHKYPHLLQEASYGLPEIFREDIKKTRLVANPGCYPTATLLALYPLLKEGIEFNSVIVDALSGVSGAGRKTVQRFHYPEMEGNMFAYSVEKHRHTPEIEDVIKRISHREVKIRFTPQVVPLVRGMMAKVYIKAEKLDYRELYRETYKDESFVVVVEEPPHVKYAVGTNMCFIFYHYDDRTSTLEMISLIDNLGKGASSQAIQNFNLLMGFEEDLGLKNTAFFP